MTRKEILDCVSTAIPSLARYDNEQGEYVEGEGDIFAAYVAKVLSEDDDPDPDLGDGGRISHLTAIFEQALSDLTTVCEALESSPSIDGLLAP